MSAVPSSNLRAREAVDPGPSAPVATARRRRTITVCVVVLTAVALAVALAVAGLAGLAHREPSWWSAVEPTDPSVVRRATDLEGAVVEDLSRVRPAERGVADVPRAWRSGVWALSIPAADANAWIAARLPKWLANQFARDGAPVEWPREIESVQVGFADGSLRVAARIAAGGRHEILSVQLEPEITPDGSLWLRARSVAIGSLPLPASILVDRAGDADRGYLPRALSERPEASAVIRALAGRQPLASDPVLALGDGRRVRVLAVRSQDGLLVLTCRTERK